LSFWRQLVRGLRVLGNRANAVQDVTDEVQHYLEQATEANIARGLSPEQALRAAHLELGGVMNISEQMRSYGWENVVQTTLGDVRYAVRRLRSAPGFSAVTVLTLGLGIGATTAIFSAVNPVLLESFPYPEADRIAMVWEVRTDAARNDATFGMYRELSERNRSFASLAVFRPWQPTLTGPDQPERFDGQRVTASYFAVLGVKPVLGRSFEPSDDRLNGPHVVVLSHRLWRRRFGADPTVVGREVTLDGAGHLVIGIMAPGFDNVLAPAADVYAPLQYDMSQGRAWGHHLRMVGRLRPEVNTDVATRELNALGNLVLEEQRPGTYGPDVVFSVASLQDDLTRSVRPALLAIFGAVILLLVIACVNVTNLLIARGAHRRGEFALRAALGAGGGRLIRQLLTEALLLALLGGVAGMVVAIVGVRALVTLSPPELPRVGAMVVDNTVFAFGFVITTLLGVACGLGPALQAAHCDPRSNMQHGSRRTAGGHQHVRGALVVAQVALALVLLVSSGLLLRSLERLFAVDAGFDPSHVLTMQVQTSGQRFADNNATYRFFEGALDAVQNVPGVTAAALTSQLPLSGDQELYGVHFDPSPAGDPGETRGTFRYAVSPGYIEAMRIPLRSGRLLDEGDRADAPYAALVSESLARRRLPGMNPIGQRLRIGAADGPLYTIVGVVGDVRQVSLSLNEPDAVYVNASQWHFADKAMSLVVRARGDVAALAPAVRHAVWSVDKDQPIVRVATMDNLLAASAAERRFALIVFGAFALAALALAAAGIYGVLSGSVAERTREIGLRSALGASRGSILALVLRQGMVLTAFGITIGLAGAALASQSITALLYGVSHLDPITYLGVIALLVAVSLIACGLPARRAARLDPASTLRAD
jgi:putative ABC transport system permease protein